MPSLLSHSSFSTNLSLNYPFLLCIDDYAKVVTRRTQEAKYLTHAKYFADVGCPCPVGILAEHVYLNGFDQWLKQIKIDQIDYEQIKQWYLNPLMLILYLADRGTNTLIFETRFFSLGKRRFLKHCYVLHYDWEIGWAIRRPGKPDTAIVDVDVIRDILATAVRIDVIAWEATGIQSLQEGGQHSATISPDDVAKMIEAKKEREATEGHQSRKRLVPLKQERREHRELEDGTSLRKPAILTMVKEEEKEKKAPARDNQAEKKKLRQTKLQMKAEAVKDDVRTQRRANAYKNNPEE